MYLKDIALFHFRSYSEKSLSCHPRMNVLFGANAQGKTNFLEAVYFLSSLKSFRGSAPKDLIQWNNSSFRLKGSIEKNDCILELQVSHDGSKREALLNHKTPSRLAVYLEKFASIALIPEHMQLIQGSPSSRRGMLDRSIFFCHSQHLDALNRCNKIIKQKKRLFS